MQEQRRGQEQKLGAEEDDFMNKPVRQAGIVNLGNTGYMDVILQQLFMCKPIRNFILSLEMSSIRTKCTSPDAEGVIVIQELQRMLRQLQTAENLPLEEESLYIQHDGLRACFPLIRSMIVPDGSYDPTNFVKAVDKSIRLWRPVDQPNDAAEFFTKCITKILSTLETVDPDKKHVLENLAVVRKEVSLFCPACNQVRRRWDQIHNYIYVPVVEYQSLTQAAQQVLKTTTKKTGACRCSHCEDQRCVSRQRFLMEDFPHLLAFRLGRFTSGQRGRTVKLHKRFEFDEFMDLDSRLSNDDLLDSIKNNATNSKQRSLCAKCGITTHLVGRTPLTNENVYQGTCIRCNGECAPSDILREWQSRNNPHLQSEDKVEKTNEIVKLKYRLMGAVVHRGTESGGRYYSFIRERSPSNRWIRFWGTSVTPASKKTMQDECFGGSVDEDGVSASAYLVFYEKVTSLG